MNLKDAALLFAVFLLMACTPAGTTATPPDISDKEPVGMDTTPTATPTATNPPAATVDATKVLEGLLRLIEGSKDIDDFTPERLEAELGISIKAVDSANWGGSALLTNQWRVNALVYPHPLSGQRTFLLDIAPVRKESQPPMAPICSMGMEQFGQRMIQQGMNHETMQGEHGMVLSNRYTREGFEIEVTGQPEEEGEGRKAQAHDCVQMVLIN